MTDDCVSEENAELFKRVFGLPVVPWTKHFMFTPGELNLLLDAARYEGVENQCDPWRDY